MIKLRRLTTLILLHFLEMILLNIFNVKKIKEKKGKNIYLSYNKTSPYNNGKNMCIALNIIKYLSVFAFLKAHVTLFVTPQYIQFFR